MVPLLVKEIVKELLATEAVAKVCPLICRTLPAPMVMPLEPSI